MRWVSKAKRRAQRALGPFGWGFASGIATVGIVSLLIFFACSSFSATPADSLFRDLLQVDLALLIAFSVASAGASVVVGDLERHLDWLGTTCSIAAAGAIAVGLNVALAAHVEADQAGSLVWLGLAWVLAASLLLGTLIALLPWATYLWNRDSDD